MSLYMKAYPRQPSPLFASELETNFKHAEEHGKQKEGAGDGGQPQGKRALPHYVSKIQEPGRSLLTLGRNSKNILTTVHENSAQGSKETISADKKLKLGQILVNSNHKRIISSATSRPKYPKSEIKAKSEKKSIIVSSKNYAAPFNKKVPGDESGGSAKKAELPGKKRW